VNKFRRHITVANVLSCTALFVALGGSAYAATKLSAGQVKAVNIASQAVTNPKIKTQAVTSGKIKNGGINAADLGSGSVINSKIANEAVGSTKLAKKAVTESKLGSEAVTTGKLDNEAVTGGKLATSLWSQLVKNVSYVNSASVTNNEPNKSATAECPSGKQALGGGVRLEGELKEVATTGSYPYFNGSLHNGWTGIAHESGAGPYGDWSIVAFAVCAEL
jgi:hypothetical protein